MSLTAKQEKFAQCVADGMTYADAYRSSYDVSAEIKDATVWRKASELMQNGKVTARINELKEALANKALWTREMSVKALVTAYNVAKQQTNASGMTGAVKELNAMHGFNAPSKVELTGQDGGPIQTEINGAKKLMDYLDAISGRASSSTDN